MAGKGFTIRPIPTVPTNPRDGATGRYIPPTSTQIADMSKSMGIDAWQLTHEVQAPDHDTPGGKNHTNQNPWPPATPPAHKPMRLK